MKNLDKIEKDIKNYNNSFDNRKSELTKRSFFSLSSRKNRIHTYKTYSDGIILNIGKNSWIDLRRKKQKFNLCSLMIFH